MSEDDHFLRAMSDVRPLKGRPKVAPRKVQKTTPGVVQRRQAAVAGEARDGNFLATHDIPLVAPHDVIGFVRPGVQHGVYGKLRRGRYEPEASLDLHRRSVEQARVELWGFVKQSLAYQLRTVIVLHGKGDRSPGGAVLKSYTGFWLESMPDVLAYHSAQPWHGGAGALYVLLKKSAKASEDNRERYARKRHD